MIKRVGILFACLIASIAHTANQFVFGANDSSSDKTAMTSPDGKYQVSTVDENVVGQSYPIHRLFVTSNTGEFRRPLKLISTGSNTYQRFISVSWSTDSRMFALNDWYGSNCSDAYLFHVEDLEHPVNIGDKVRELIRKNKNDHTLENNFHTYVFASKWLSGSLLEVRLAGDYTEKLQRKSLSGVIPLNHYTKYFVLNATDGIVKKTKETDSMDLPNVDSDNH